MRARTFSIGKRRTSYSRNRTGWRTIAPGIGQWTPGNLLPYAWYDAHLGGTSTEITDSSANSRAALAFAAGSNSPLHLPYNGAAHVRLPGTGTGNTLRAASATFYRQATELDVRIAVTPSDWTPAFQRVLVGTFGNVAFNLFLGTSGALIWTVGATTSTSSATPGGAALATGYSDGDLGVIRATWRNSDGRVQFFTKSGVAAADAMTELRSNSDWVQLGADQTNSLSAVDNVSTSVGLMGYGTGASQDEPCVVWGGWLSTTIGGPVSTEFDPASSTQTGYTSGGQAWTVFRSTTVNKKTVILSPAAGSARGVALFGTDDYAVMPAAAMPTLGTTGTGTVVVVKRSWATIATGDRLLDSRADTTTTTLGLAMHHDASTAASFRFAAGDGTNTAGSTLTSANVTGTRTVYAGIVSATEMQAFRNNVFATAATRPALTIDTGGDVQIGRNAGGTEYSDMELTAVLTFDRVLTAGELARICTYYGAGV